MALAGVLIAVFSFNLLTASQFCCDHQRCWTATLQESVFGADGTLLFFGCVCVAFIPFAVFCLPETKGLSLETILPMFEFHGEQTANFLLAADLRCAVDGRTLPLLFEDY
jgi:hypothetical protein